MARYSINKKTLFIAAMIIILCLVSVTGATLALFTSSGEDGKIGINATSGDLEVDIVDASDDPESLIGDVLDFVTTADNKTILFEPGATYHTEGFRVKNIGSIPMKYFVYIGGESDADDKFIDAFEVWLTTDPMGRNGMVKMQEFNGELAKGQSSEVYYLVFRMKEDAGNEYQNTVFTGVGITVCAVQSNGYIEIDRGE